MAATDDRPRRLDAAVRERLTVSWERARTLIRGGKISVAGAVVLDIAAAVGEGAEIAYAPDAPRPRAEDLLLPPAAIVHVDREIAVVDKPSGLLTVPFERGDRPTLDRLLHAILSRREKRSGTARRGTARTTLYVVHRLDRNTSGLLVFARSPAARDRLKEQFREHTAHRRYLALVHGRIAPGVLHSHLLPDRGDGLRGSVENAPRWIMRPSKTGKTAITHVEVIEAIGPATLVACRLETGRTNQIRIHLSEAGHPLLGETIYMRHYAGPAVAAPRLMLHAAELGFVHPGTGRQVRFESRLPDEMAAFVAALRAGGATAPR
jgi:23S rRNA pseudouridine1911/1915/1917 synthase